MFGGALVIAFAAMNKQNVLEEGLNIIVAIILFLFGLFAIVASFAFEQNRVVTNGIIYGSASIAFGVFLCTDKLVLLEYLVYLLAIFFIVVGSINLIKGVMLIIRKSEKRVLLVVTFIMATLFIAAGVLGLIFSDKVRIICCIIAGVILFAIGVYLLITGIATIIGSNKDKNKPARKQKEKKSKKEKPAEEEQVEEEPESEPEPQEIKELDYTADKPAELPAPEDK